MSDWTEARRGKAGVSGRATRSVEIIPMERSRLRFTIRWIMAAVAIAALATYGLIVWARAQAYRDRAARPKALMAVPPQ
jgi:hypothetical protein